MNGYLSRGPREIVMALHWQLVMDTADPHRQARFWADALGYLVEDHSVLIEQLRAARMVIDADLTEVEGRPSFAGLAGIRHPEDPFDPVRGAGQGRRILFQRVPEGKTAKNRVHLDLNVGPDRRDAEVTRLKGLGAGVLSEVRDRGSHHVTMQDPEGNEFDVQ
jgi:catechol 2,3-dioxygenase-like lactoylglutathione lyase family enzyme